jgi:major vault protein
VVLGPKTFTVADHEKIVLGPEQCLVLPPRHYVVIANPAERDAKGAVVLDKHGQTVIRFGDEEIRFEQDPFPLYPGEKMVGRVTPLQVVAPNQALRLKAIRDFYDELANVNRVAGDEWLFEGPATYKPRVEVQVVEIIRATVITVNQALKLRARQHCTDRHGNRRKAGEEWLHRDKGAYLPGVDEVVVEKLEALVLTDRVALHLRAKFTFVDSQGVQRKAGEEWMVTSADETSHIVDVNEELVKKVDVTVVSSRQYCVVVDPFDAATKKTRLGQKELRRGPATFFLYPGESIEVHKFVHVLGEEEALLLRATEAGEGHEPGDRWMVYGPLEFVPSVTVEIVERRRAIPLDTTEGIYVRDIKSGRVYTVQGKSYMLKPNEELWEKDLPDVVEEILARNRSNLGGARDKTRVVTYRAAHNTAVQIYDYRAKTSRVVVGPELVMLGPEEQFTVLSLSGGKPKRPHQIRDIALRLGPDFSTDIIVVETSDHARLSLKLSYNWKFELNEEDKARVFQVPDFVGDCCKAIASRVRGIVAQTTFDMFHRSSSTIIRDAVFGKDKNRFVFDSNGLQIFNVDVQAVEPVDQKTRDSLQKSVQLAIEISTKSLEAAARHESDRLEQESRGKLERQKILDQAASEEERSKLLQLQAATAAVESTGTASSESKAKAEALQIECEAEVTLAELKAKASSIETNAELDLLKRRRGYEVAHQEALDSLEITLKQEMAKIESEKMQKMVAAIGPDTIAAISRAGPELQAKLLGGLNLKSALLTDGTSPINLFNASNGLIGMGGK